jgi:hypothetical protein
LACFGQLLGVFFETVDSLVDLGSIELPEVEGLFDAIAKGGDCSGVAIFAFSDYDSGWAFSDAFVVVGEVLAD